MLFYPLLLKGFILGITAVTPGISIGTMALIFKVYEPALTIFTRLFSTHFWRNKKEVFSAIAFLSPLAIGTAVSMYLCSQVLLWIFTYYTVFVKFFFTGIILASIPGFFTTYIQPHLKISQIFLIILGYALILLLGYSVTEAQSSTELVLTVSELLRCLLFSAIASGASLIPGISGSYVLLLLGYYSMFLSILSSVNIAFYITLAIGAGIGFFCSAFLMRFLFRKAGKITYAVIFGMILASLQKILPVEELRQNTFPPLSLTIGIALSLLLGLALTFVSMRLGEKK